MQVRFRAALRPDVLEDYSVWSLTRQGRAVFDLFLKPAYLYISAR